MIRCVSIFQRSYSVAKNFITKLHKKPKNFANKHNKLHPMRDRMSKHSTYFHTKMDSMNDSVIICDTSSTPEPKGIDKRRNRQAKRVGCKNTVDNLKNKLANFQMRSPLRTVYESPLDHRVHNTCNGNSSVVINLAAKRFRKDQNTDIQPPKKKQKIRNLNETIVIVSDDEPEPSIPSKTSDVVLVKHSKKSVPKTIPKKSPKRRGKKRRSLRIHKQMIAKNATKAEADRDDEEIAVIWSSTDGGTNERLNEKPNNPDPSKDLFFVDTAGDKSNYEKECLQDIVTPPPTSSTCQVQAPVTKKSKVRGRKKSKGQLREIIVDGCNVAIGYSHSNVFTKMGLKLVYDYFRERGHAVKIFLPQHQRKKGREYLETWYRRGDVIFTPSRQIGGKNIVSYDDRFIVEYATKCKGIIVTSDQYRDLWEEKPEWRDTIEKRLIVPTFVGDYVMFPEDPLGRKGPKLDEFLRH